MSNNDDFGFENFDSFSQDDGDDFADFSAFEQGGSSDYESFSGDLDDDPFSDDFDMDGAAFPPSGGRRDDDLRFDEDENGGNRSFFLIGGCLLLIFVVISAIIAVLLLSDDDTLPQEAILATTIVVENQTTEALVQASSTAAVLQQTQTQQAIFDFQTATAGAVLAEATRVAEQQQTVAAIEAANATALAQSTEIFEAGETATAEAIIAAETATAEAISAAETATAIGPEDTPEAEDEPEEDEATATPAPTDTPQPSSEDGRDLEGQLVGLDGAPLAGVTICVFLDDGDGVFNPDPSTTGECAPTFVLPDASADLATATPPGTVDEGDEPPTEIEIEATATPAEQRPLNPIFATATAAASGRIGGNIPPSPTPEGSSFDPNIYQPLGRSIPDPQAQRLIAQTGGGDGLAATITTDSQGRFVISGLPPGTYFITIGGRLIEITVRPEPQIITIDAEGDIPAITLVVEAAAQVPTPTPEDVGGAIPSETPSELPDTGLFDGRGDDISGFDLMILALIGTVLVGVVFAARRMRGLSPT